MQCPSLNKHLTTTVFALISLAVIGEILLWVFAYAPIVGKEAIGTHAWYLFSFLSGVAMVGLPCSLPILLIIVPLMHRKGPSGGLSLLFAFSIGVIFVLSFYGGILGFGGRAAMESISPDGSGFKDWVYLFGGIFTYVLALGELGLVRFRLRPYVGALPHALRRHIGFAGAFLLGIFLGNVGVGSAAPAVPLLMIQATSSGSGVFGVILFFVHALGRIIPLLVIALFAAYSVNGIRWLVAHKDRIDRANGWVMLWVSGGLITLGAFAHEWWSTSTLHSLIARSFYGQEAIPAMSLYTPEGLFGQPHAWGIWTLLLLWFAPLWWHYVRERRRVHGTPDHEIRSIEHHIDRLEEDRRGIEAILHFHKGVKGEHLVALERQIDMRETKRRVLEDGLRYDATVSLRDPQVQRYEEDLLRLRGNWYLTLTLLAVLLTVFFL